MGVGYNPKIVTSGLVSCLDADNIKSYAGSGATWTDLIGNATTTLYNTPTFNSSGFLTFDGTTQYGIGGNNANINPGIGDCSAIVWCKSNSAHNDGITHRILAKGASSDADPGWAIITASNGINVSVCASTTRTGPTGATLVIGEWTQFVMVVNRTAGITTYKNGVAAGNVAVGAGTLTGTANLTVGGLTAANYFNGSLASILLYNRALSSDEVRQNFNALRGRFGI